MGFNTTVVVLNDGLGAILKNPEQFARNLAEVIINGQFPAWVFCKGGGNVAQVVESHHADHRVIVEVGGNCGREVSDVKR